MDFIFLDAGYPDCWVFNICLMQLLFNILPSYCYSGKCFTLVTGMLHLASSQMQERDIYCLSFLPSYPQARCSQSVSHVQPCWGSCLQPVLLLPWARSPLGAMKLRVVPPLPCISHPCIQWSAWQTPAACLFSCPVPKQQCAHRCLLLFKQAKHNTFVCFFNLWIF